MASPIRLCIGSGDKRDDGWIGIDQAGRLGNEPDVVADVRKLPFPDDYADEARAIHVIEHFYPWEAPSLVREWVRVIKPGAKLAIECPCIDKVLYLMQVPEIPTNFTYWALYGDPRHQDPAMMHHWCYGKAQLIRLMTTAGLVDLKAEPALFHHPIRDMRVVGTKPTRIVHP